MCFCSKNCSEQGFQPDQSKKPFELARKTMQPNQVFLDFGARAAFSPPNKLALRQCSNVCFEQRYNTEQNTMVLRRTFGSQCRDDCPHCNVFSVADDVKPCYIGLVPPLYPDV